MSSIPQPPPKTELYLSVDDSAEWLACWPQVVAYGPNTYLKLNTDEVDINLYASRDKLITVLEGLVGQLKRAKPEAKQTYTLAQLAALPLTHPARLNFVATASPSQMLEFMKHCPALSPHLAEFETVFNNQANTLSHDIALVENAGLGPADLLDELDQPRWGAQTKIGQALGIPNAGQANRERINAILDIMRGRKKSTTPTKPQHIQPREAVA
jgi:hypothetical protein